MVTRKSSAPNWFVTAFQVWSQTNEIPNVLIESRAPAIDLVDDQTNQGNYADGGQRGDPAKGEISYPVYERTL